MSGLEFRALGVSRGGRAVVGPISARVPAGSVTALVGPNGAGKSSLLGAVAGVLPYAGALSLEGRPPLPGEIAYMPQASAVGAALTVLEVVLLGRVERLGWRIAAEDLARAADALGLLGLTALAERRIDMLSGGQQQLVLLAQRLVRRPRLLILDEPTSALDLHRQLQVLECLVDVATATGAVVLVALHDLSLAARYAARLLLLKEGMLLSAGDPGEVLTRETIRDAYGIEAEILRTSAGHPMIAPLGPAGPPG